MSLGERGLAAVSHLIVASWIIGYLAYQGWETGSELTDAQRAAPPSAPVHSTPVSPSPGSPAGPSAAAAPEPVSKQALALGRELLASGGAFPALNATYEDFSSFRRYAQSMLDLGARFVVVRDRRIVGQADIETGIVSPFENGASFSPIPRDYSHEPALVTATAAVRREHGRGAQVKMLLPRDLDAGLFGGIAEALAARGEAPELYTEIQGRYEPASGGGVWFRIESGTRSDGETISLSRVFDLSALAGTEPRS